MSNFFSQRTSQRQRQSIQQLGRVDLERRQCEQFNRLLNDILPENKFYDDRLAEFKRPLDSIAQLQTIPFTHKHELISTDDSTSFAANLTFPLQRYSRFHRTSGTQGRPMVVLDTPDDWQWWMEGWQYVLDAAELSASDRVTMAFSFGPFIGFWSAFDAAVERGAMVAPTGAMSTIARLELIASLGSTVVFCTPSYALHMAEVAAQNAIDIASTPVRVIVVAGEPGGSIESIRNKIEVAWQAKVIDHSGASEIGPWGFADPHGQGIYVNESQFIAEFISLESGQPAKPSELSELVLTTLGRVGSPVIRYRTGDLVKPIWDHNHNENFVLLQGGVLGRTDDMMIIRGVNVFPSAIEQILRGFPEISEYRMTASKSAVMDQLSIEIEDALQDPSRVEKELHIRLGLRVDVQCVPTGSLPRFEAKGKRFVDKR